MLVKVALRYLSLALGQKEFTLFSTSKMYRLIVVWRRLTSKPDSDMTLRIKLLVLAWSSLWLSSAQEYLPSGVLFVSRSVVDSAKTSSFCRIMRNITLMPDIMATWPAKMAPNSHHSLQRAAEPAAAAAGRASRQLESPLYNGGKNRTLSQFLQRSIYRGLDVIIIMQTISRNGLYIVSKCTLGLKYLLKVVYCIISIHEVILWFFKKSQMLSLLQKWNA